MVEGWSKTPIGQVIRIATGQVDPKDEHVKTLLSVGPENIRIGGGINYGSLKTAHELVQISGKYAFDQDAILYSKIRPNLNKVGLPEFQGICSADVYPIWVNDVNVIDKAFLYHILTSEKFVADASSRSFRTGLPKINRPDLESITIDLPPLPEQRKIAEILRTWDEAIEQSLQLTVLRQKQYKGLRERLVDWLSNERTPLRGVLEPVSRPVNKPVKSYRALSIRSHGKGAYIRTVADPNTVAMDTLYQVKVGDLIVNITFAWEGAIALVTEEQDGCLVSHRFPTYLPDEELVSARYLRHSLRMPRFTYLLTTISPGGAGRNRVLNKTDFLNLEVPYPKLSEQKKIAQILDDAETAIERENKYREALKRQKRGLMQKLLTGDWRVTP